MADNAGLQEAFGNPTVAYDQKRKVLETLITRTKVLPTTANFLRVLLRNQRLAELAEVNAKLAEVLDERTGIVSAQVISARPVADATKTSLEQKLTQLTGKKAHLTFETDESLLQVIPWDVGQAQDLEPQRGTHGAFWHGAPGASNDPPGARDKPSNDPARLGAVNLRH